MRDAANHRTSTEKVGSMVGFTYAATPITSIKQTVHCLSPRLSTHLFAYFQPAPLYLTFWSCRHLREIVHANLIRHHLYISPPLCRDAIILILDLLEKHAALALSSCASHNTLSGLLLMCSLQRATLLASFFHPPSPTNLPVLHSSALNRHTHAQLSSF